MTHGRQTSSEVWGFLTVLEHESLGLVGGYLLLNPAGRPLEFHCTTPVRPNRAQRILFGPTLAPYLYGEQIGATLLAAGSHEPLVVYTDVERALAVREFIAPPVALVLNRPDEADTAEVADARSSDVSLAAAWRRDPPQQPSGHLVQFTLGQNRLAAARAADRDAIVGYQERLATFDLAEPFGRIREAIDEAHRGKRVA